MDKIGEFIIRGTAIEDVCNILRTNGYVTEVFTPCQPTTRFNEVEHYVKVYSVRAESEEN